MKPLLIFDYDGTINESMTVYEPSLRALFAELVNENILTERELTTEEISSYLGMNVKDMWSRFAPHLPWSEAVNYSARLTKIIFEMVENGKAKWYPGMEAFLEGLKARGYSMVILSNSKKINGEIYFRVFDMPRFFDKWYDSESFNWAPKTEIIQAIIKDYNTIGSNVIVFGDRNSDYEGAKEIGAKFVGCAYGYGQTNEIKDADYTIEEPCKEEFQRVTDWIKNVS